MRYFILAVLTCWLSSAVNAQAEPLPGNDWKLVNEDERMKVYSRLTEKSKFKEVKIDVTLRAPAEKIVDFISVASKFPEWIYSCSEAYSFVEEGFDDIYYIRFDMMWPVSDRDIVQYSITKRDSVSGVYDILTRTIDGKIPEKRNVVRVPGNRITWRIIPLGPGKTRILYHAVADPGGWVPAWIMNQAVTIGPRRTMENLIRAVE
jgi:hypothetical protein